MLLLTSYPARIAVLRRIATKDLSTQPIRMRILSERSELRILHPGWLYGTKDLSSHPRKNSLSQGNVTTEGPLCTLLPFALCDKSVKIRDEPHDA
jgi:hypothetical protein